MTVLSHEVVIAATPEKVFDLISRVEDFSKYSTYIKEVRAIGDKRFLWRVKAFGLKLEWEAEVTEERRPEYFAWRSTSGVYNTGRYVLTPVEQFRTRVSFTMEYRLESSRKERLIATLAEPIMDSLFKDCLHKVKAALEG